MKEQLISFETAKLAWEKGFNEKCMNFYTAEEHPHRKIEGKKLTRYGSSNYEIHPAKFYRNETLQNSDNDLFEWLKGYTAPTQSLLQKWLREKHNTHLEITMRDNKWVCWVYNLPFDDYLDTEIASTDGNSYEEALEKGLQEALKLI